MSVVVARLDESELPPNVLRLRAHAALVRTLLDELERAAPSPAGRPGAARLSCLAEHLAEELGSLARRMLECATIATLLAADTTRGQSEPAAPGLPAPTRTAFPPRQTRPIARSVLR